MLSWLGAITGIIGGILVALNFEWSKFGYVFFIISSISWMIRGVKIKDNALVVLNIFFTFINILGIYQWFL